MRKLQILERVIVAALCVGLGLLPDASLAQTYGGDEFQLRAKHSNKCLDVAWYSRSPGGDIVQSECSSDPVQTNQTWSLYQGSISSPVLFMAEHSGMVMDVLYQSVDHGADVVQNPWSGGWSGYQSWLWNVTYVETEDGIPWYMIRNTRSNKCLDVAWFSMANGGNVLQATCTGTDNQLWDFHNLSLDIHHWP